MNCDSLIDRISDRLKGLLDERAALDLERHLETCDDCRLEAHAIEQMWGDLGRLEDEVPSDRMRARFYGALHAYQERDRGGLLARLRRGFESLWPARPAHQLAMTAAALLVGLLGGGWLLAPGGSEIESLRSEMRSMERAVSLTLLEHQSASERLRGVELGIRNDPDERVIESLIAVVADDPNVNVRLAAVQALAPLLDHPRVGRELLNTIDRQRSPMVQVTLAEALLGAGVNGSRPAVERLLEDGSTDPTVREYLRELMRSSS
jgi:hypothetical protein